SGAATLTKSSAQNVRCRTCFRYCCARGRAHSQDSAPEITIGEGQKRGPVGRVDVSLAVLAEGNVSVNQRGLDRRELCRSHVFPAKEAIDRPCGSRGHEAALRVYPTV